MDAELLSQCNDPYFSKLYSFIKKAAVRKTMHGDSIPMWQFTTGDIEHIRDIQHEAIQSNIVASGSAFQTPKECFNDVLLKIAGDAILGSIDTGVGPVTNPIYKYGSFNDPTSYTHATMPISLSPMETSALYADGGLASIIIDKKSRAMLMNGATFTSSDEKFWNGDKIDELTSALEATGFNDVAMDAVCFAFLYGGACLYPELQKDTLTSFLKRPVYEKDCIKRWVTVDRWNITYVPSYTVTAQDYLRPPTILIPMSSIELNTERVSMIRPRQLPYWAAIVNLGWCPSDLTGWLRSYYAYMVTQMSVPVMAQQMSLLLYKLPLDALQATLGKEAVEKLMSINEEKMAQWNSLSPKAVNMVGEVEVVDRTYSGFEQFVGAVKSDLASQCGIPEPALFHTPNKGFSDNTQESLLKQSEILQMNQKVIEKALTPARDAIVGHVYGMDSKEYKMRDKVRLTMSRPVISTEKDRAEIGARFAASVNSFVQAGVSPDTAMKLSKPFFPSVRITDEMLQMAKSSYDNMMSQQQQAKVGGSNNGPKTQSPSNRIF